MKAISKYKAVIISFICVCLWGGYYDFVVACFGGMFSTILLFMYRSNKKIQIPKCFITYGLIIIQICSVISTFTAVDRGMAVLGVMRVFVVFLFWLVWNNITNPLRKELYDTVPVVGSFLTLLAFMGYFIPVVQGFLYRADRLGGVFQYSNTYAMFLLIGFLMLFVKEDWNKCEKIEMIVLFLGIFFTGSRSVFVLTAISIVIAIFGGKSDSKKKIILVIAGIVLLAVLQAVFSLDIKRLLEISLDSSTLNGRFLYWRDAIPVIIKNPFGLGYMGYYYYQSQFQTGNYLTIFVHNGILQVALDMGIIAMLVVIGIVFAGILSKNNGSLNRGMLLLLFLHTLFDFDMQYSVMIFLALMFLGEQSQDCFEIKHKSLQVINSIVCIVFIYFGIALGAGHLGFYEASLTLYPGNTQVRESQMLTDIRTGKENAEILIKENGYLASAYDVSMQIAISDGDYLSAVEYGNEMLKCAAYNSDYYNKSVYYLSYALDDAVKDRDESTAKIILETIKKIPDRIAEKEAQASKLAYRINDKPEILLEEEIEAYIENLN